jgi:hypothetical protein
LERSVKVLGNEAREVAGWAVAFILFFDTMALLQTKHLSRVGPEPYIYSVYTVFLQENHQIYGHIRCIYTVLANPTHIPTACYGLQSTGQAWGIL